MAEDTKKKKSSTNTSNKNKSKVSSNIKKKQELMELDSDLLLEQIMNKKRKKQAQSKSKKQPSKKTLVEVSSDELYDQIMAKKKAKKSSKGKIEDKTKVKNKIVIDIVKDTKKIDDIDTVEQKKDLVEKVNQELKKEPKKKKIEKLWILFVLFGLIALIFFIQSDAEVDYIGEEKKNAEKVIDERPQLYDACLTEPLSVEDTSLEIESYIEELNQYIKANYRASIMNEDLTLGYSYSYNIEPVYYAASTIKSLDALYIYTKAALGEINLDDTMTYTSKFKWGSSSAMKNHKYGDEVSLRNLVKYAVTVSDNSAHQMLVSYIGFSNLKEFGKSLGAQYTLYGGDNFGSITVSDGLVYMKAINDFINNNGELGLELKSYFVAAEQNDLKIDEFNIEAAHKYGQYDKYYHDIGIVYDEDPYVIAILTNEGNKTNFEEIVKDINEHVYKLHRMYNDNREDVCYLRVYGS